jgi:hypothetical protein
VTDHSRCTAVKDVQLPTSTREPHFFRSKRVGDALELLEVIVLDQPADSGPVGIHRMNVSAIIEGIAKCRARIRCGLGGFGGMNLRETSSCG